MQSQLERVSRRAWQRNLDGFRLIWPDAEVVRFFGRLAPRGERSGIRVLDLGCGGGRHLACLTREGYEAWGVDYNEIGLAQAQEVVLAEGGEPRLALADVADPPYADGFFDAVLAWGILFHTTPDRAATMLSQIRRVLRPGGRVLSNWRSDEDDLRKQGRPVDPQRDGVCGGEADALGKTYLMSGGAAVHGLEETLYTFSSREDLEDRYGQAGLAIDNLERRDLWINNMTMRCSWWIVWATKPEDA